MKIQNWNPFSLGIKNKRKKNFTFKNILINLSKILVKLTLKQLLFYFSYITTHLQLH